MRPSDRCCRPPSPVRRHGLSPPYVSATRRRHPSTVSSREQIEGLEHQFMDAVRRRDASWLEGRLRPEFVLVTGRPGHEVRSREEWLRVTAEEYSIESFGFDELEVLDYGEV